MKNVFSVLVLVIISLLSVSIGGCDSDEEVKPAPVDFVSANPPSGSTIQPNTTITITFDDAPGNVVVNLGQATTAGRRTVEISGPFPAGALTIAISWNGASHELHYTVVVPEPGTEGMVRIPAGEFQMGSNAPEARKDEQPVHTVYVDAFFMDQHEVTNLEYQQFVLANPSWQKNRIDKRFHNGNGTYLRHWNGNEYPGGKSKHPVQGVGWYAAMGYAVWLGKRLPTEAEWEYAARGGLSGKKYPWGDVITPQKANYGRNVGRTTPVGKYPPNGYGLYDMVGNVQEWCLDQYDTDFYSRSPLNNPLAGAHSIDWLINNFTSVKSNEFDRTTYRVLRGSSWFRVPTTLRVASRVGTTPAVAATERGFRCVRDQ